MKARRLIFTGAALLSVGGCGDGHDLTAPASSVQASSSALAAATRQVEAAGEFAAQVDFSTLTLTPREQNCLLEVAGQLVFTGTIEGTATGRTTALDFAPCSEAGANPPLYAGRVQQGGQIEGRLIFSNGIAGRLDADAIVAVGGTYSGSVVVR
ncbi:MAG: hypothetical protein ACT4PJ_03030 [Gemmatimonadaceae bacterium]